MSYVATGFPPGPRLGNSAIWTPERKAEVKRMALERMTYAQIGKAMGVSRCSIGGVVGRLKDIGDFPLLAPRKVRLFPQPLHKRNSSRVDGNNNLSAPKLPKTDIRRVRPVSGKGKLIQELGDKQCRLATGFDKQGQHLFCGAPTEHGSWCEYHAARVFKIKRRGFSKSRTWENE